MRSLFSQSQTPTAPRRAVGFFRFGCPSGCPAWLITQSTSGQQVLFRWEFATLSFPCWHLARIGCQLPDAILHGKRSYRPHSRAVQRLAAAEFRVKPLGSLRLAFADADWRTRWRHVRDCISASLPFSAGTATVFDSALARCHGSGLLTLRLPFAHMPAVFFSTSPASWKIYEACLLSDPSRRERSFCNTFQCLSVGSELNHHQSHPLRAGAQ
jgi:hypothetical protein